MSRNYNIISITTKRTRMQKLFKTLTICLLVSTGALNGMENAKKVEKETQPLMIKECPECRQEQIDFQDNVDKLDPILAQWGLMQSKKHLIEQFLDQLDKNTQPPETDKMFAGIFAQSKDQQNGETSKSQDTNSSSPIRPVLHHNEPDGTRIWTDARSNDVVVIDIPSITLTNPWLINKALNKAFKIQSSEKNPTIFSQETDNLFAGIFTNPRKNKNKI